MNILRLGVEDHRITLNLFNEGKEEFYISAPTIAELSIKLPRDKDIFSGLSGIFVYRGPGGYSKLRSIWAFAYGLSLSGVPIKGYKKWSSYLSTTLPHGTNKSIFYGDTIE